MATILPSLSRHTHTLLISSYLPRHSVSVHIIPAVVPSLVKLMFPSKVLIVHFEITLDIGRS